jgi:hypothetical protein
MSRTGTNRAGPSQPGHSSLTWPTTVHSSLAKPIKLLVGGGPGRDHDHVVFVVADWLVWASPRTTCSSWLRLGGQVPFGFAYII